jgi:hypothetical protein
MSDLSELDVLGEAPKGASGRLRGFRWAKLPVGRIVRQAFWMLCILVGGAVLIAAVPPEAYHRGWYTAFLVSLAFTPLMWRLYERIVQLGLNIPFVSFFFGYARGILKVAVLSALTLAVAVPLWLTWLPEHEGAWNSLVFRAERVTGIKGSNLSSWSVFRPSEWSLVKQVYSIRMPRFGEEEVEDLETEDPIPMVSPGNDSRRPPPD